MELKESINNYWNRDADDYNRGSSLHKGKTDQRTERWNRLYCNAFPPDARTILDVGTGPGVIAIMLAEGGYDVTAIDFSPDMLAHARENALKRDLSITFKQSDTESLPFADESFDVIVSRFVLWTVVDPQIVVNEWHRVLKPGGRVVYADGNWYKTDNTLKRKIWFGLSTLATLITERRDSRYDDLTDEMKQSLWSVKANRPAYDHVLLENAGFSDISVIESIEPYVSDWMEYIKQGYWGPRFLVSASK